MKAVVIGSGLGGLLAGAELSKEGYDVEIFERLPFIGGRFTNLEYKGFKLSTGALHMIPHGSRGPLAQMLNELGADVTIVDSQPMATIMMKNKHLTFEDFKKLISLSDRMKFAFLTFASRILKPNISFKDWVSKYFEDELIARFVDSFCGWALSLKSEEIQAKEMLEIIHNVLRYGGPGIPMGGCGAITDALAQIINSNGGKLHTRAQVDRIIIHKGHATGISVNGRRINADLVISDIGHSETSRMYRCTDNEYLQKISRITPSKGIKICIASEKPLISHSGVVFTPFAQRINGINEVTNADPSLAPPKKHLVMSHQTLVSNDLKEEIRLGLLDLKKLFPDGFKVLLIQCYHDGWPVNRSKSGSDIGNTTPIHNLYIVGDGAKGKGGIEVEGIALGVRNVMKKIKN